MVVKIITCCRFLSAVDRFRLQMVKPVVSRPVFTKGSSLQYLFKSGQSYGQMLLHLQFEKQVIHTVSINLLRFHC